MNNKSASVYCDVHTPFFRHPTIQNSIKLNLSDSRTTNSYGRRNTACRLTFRHRASFILGQEFRYSPRTLFIYLINKYISLSDVCLTVYHWYI